MLDVSLATAHQLDDGRSILGATQSGSNTEPVDALVVGTKVGEGVRLLAVLAAPDDPIRALSDELVGPQGVSLVDLPQAGRRPRLLE